MTPEQFNALRSDILAEVRQVTQEATSPYRDRMGAAAYLNCSPGKIDQYLASGELPKHWIGSKPLVRVADLDALVERETIKGRRRNFSRRAA